MTSLPLSPPGMVNNWLKGDKNENRAHQWMEWDGSWDLDVAFYGIPFDGLSAVRTGSRHGPDAVRMQFANFTVFSPTDMRSMDELRVADIGDVDVIVSDYKRTFENVTNVARHLIESGIKIVSIGGDHSIAEPNVEGILQAMPGKRLGFIHIDEHNDVREGHLGGYCSGDWGRELLNNYPDQMLGKNVCKIGMSEFTNNPKDSQYVQDMGATVVTAVEVWEKGIRYAIDKALEVAGDGTDAIYISIDVDGMDQSSAPGTPAPNPFGIDARDVAMAVRQWARHPKTIGVEIAELVPAYDHDNMTANVTAILALNFCYGVATRDMAV